MDAMILLHAGSAVVLLLVGALAILAPKRRRSPHPWLGRAYFGLLIVALAAGMAVGQRDPAISVFEIVTPPTFALGVLGITAGVRRKPWLGRQWLFWHIQGQAGSYIGVVTATLFQVVPRFAGTSLPVIVAIAVLPTIVGTALIIRTHRARGTLRPARLRAGTEVQAR